MKSANTDKDRCFLLKYVCSVFKEVKPAEASLVPLMNLNDNVYDHTITNSYELRGYQKSIIEMELEEKRKDKGMLWQQTKESILEARGIISSNNSITGQA